MSFAVSYYKECISCPHASFNKEFIYWCFHFICCLRNDTWSRRSFINVSEWFNGILNRCIWCIRSSRPEAFFKKGLLRSFAKFTGKHLCQSFFLNKIAGLRPETLLKERLWQRCFPVNFAKICKNAFFHRTTLMAASVWC